MSLRFLFLGPIVTENATTGRTPHFAQDTERVRIARTLRRLNVHCRFVRRVGWDGTPATVCEPYTPLGRGCNARCLIARDVLLCHRSRDAGVYVVNLPQFGPLALHQLTVGLGGVGAKLPQAEWRLIWRA